MITIDFESRSSCDLPTCGVYKYALDPSTEVLCMAYTGGFWKRGDPPPEEVFNHINNGGLIEAHNAEFEFVIWNTIMHARYGWPRLYLDQLRCSAARAAALGLPRSLKELGATLELPLQKGDDRLMLRMSKPRKPTKHDKSPWHEKPEDLEKLYEYCRRDVAVEESLPIRKLIPIEQKTWELTTIINQRGIYCDVNLCKRAITLATQYNAELSKELIDISEGRITSVGQVARILKEVPIDNLQEGTIEDTLLKPTGLTPYQIRLLEIRRALSKSSIKKYESMVAMACPDNRIRGTQLYHGAHPGRWTGRGVQPQNLAKGEVHPDLYRDMATLDYAAFREKHTDMFETLSAGVRGMLRAEPGKQLISRDYTAIEARVVCWLAGDKNLAAFDKGDPYLDIAAEVYDLDRKKMTKQSPERKLGKAIILGCGYGMGSVKFQHTCLQQGIEIDEAFAKYAVNSYRTKYRSVVRFWYDIQNAATETIRSKTVNEVRGITFYLEDNFLFCRLPSGRELAYHKPRLTPAIEYRNGVTTYGGKLVENITQAVARDILRDAMFRLDNAGFKIILTVHDEIVCEGGNEKEFEQLMAVTPKWATGLPIAVEGWQDERYRK